MESKCSNRRILNINDYNAKKTLSASDFVRRFSYNIPESNTRTSLNFGIYGNAVKRLYQVKARLSVTILSAPPVLLIVY
jgi:hypothetical protein